MTTSNKLTAAEVAAKYHNAKPENTKKRKFGYVKTPTEYQMEVSECGAASLSMILQYYGKYVPLEKLRYDTGVSRNGCNAKNIYIAAENYGMEVTASRRNTERLLEKNTPPCMLHWNYTHFVVFEGIRFGKYILNDPAKGRRRLTKEEFEEGYSGTVLQFTPGKNFYKSNEKRTLFEFVKSRLEPQKTTLLALILIGIALIVPGILYPVFGQVFADDILVEGKIEWTKFILLLMALSLIFDTYFSYINSLLTLNLRTKISLVSTDSMIGHMLRLPMVFFEQRYAGDLVGRISNNISVSSFLSSQFVSVVVSVFTSIFYLLIMILYNPKLALIGVSFSVFSVLVSVIISSKITSLTYKFGIDNGKMYGYLYNGLANSASLKAVGSEEEYIGRLFGYYAEVCINDQKLGKLQTILDTIPDTIKAINNVLVLIIGSKVVIDGGLTPGGLIAFTSFLGAFTSPFSSIISFTRSLQQTKNDMARVEDIMRYPEDEYYTSKKMDSLIGEKLKGDVEISNLSFSYGKLDEPFIRKFSLVVHAGGSVALVGSSGCGKSTIAKMLSSLYTPREGSILFDGYSIDEIPSEVISSSIAVVTQNISLFDGSIYDNITTWNSGITQEKVIRAAKDACIHDEIIAKPGSYDYILSENGHNISGGQRQRIEIAKALAMEPTILILDEATSALDPITEKQILDNIKRRHMTLIVVAQRLSTIRDCDEIVVMERGKIKERGTHEQLLSLNGLYSNLVKTAE